MTKLLASAILLPFIIFPVPMEPFPVTSGYWSRYAEEPTLDTIHYRQAVGDLPLDLSGYAGVIAVADCKLVGRDAWIQVEDSKWLRTIIFDCSGHAETSRWMKEGRIIGELGYGLAKELGTTRRGGVPGKLWVP